MPWLLLLYRLPAQPSAPRVAVWRALQRLPGASLQKGVYMAPRHDEADLLLRSLAHDIRNYGGEAMVMDVADVDDEAALRRRLAEEGPAAPMPVKATATTKATAKKKVPTMKSRKTGRAGGARTAERTQARTKGRNRGDAARKGGRA